MKVETNTTKNQTRFNTINMNTTTISDNITKDNNMYMMTM